MRNQSAACDPEDVDVDELTGGKITRKDDVDLELDGFADESEDGDEALAQRVPAAAPTPAAKKAPAKKAAPRKKATAKKSTPRKATKR